VRFVYSLLFGSNPGLQSNRLFESHMSIIARLEQLFLDAEARGEFRPSFDPTWLVFQLLGLANSHSMLLIKELDYVDEADQAKFLEERTSRAVAERIVSLFLRGSTQSE
jgi:hypothetical protein